jgi:DNA-binding transcriptional MerR regulator
MARIYQHTQELLSVIKELLAQGMSQREIEERLDLKGSRPVHQLLMRENRKERRMAAGIMPRPKGRPRKDEPARDIVAEQAYEIQRLKMENELLRDFLSLTGKG